jgi:hypothetical protein
MVNTETMLFLAPWIGVMVVFDMIWKGIALWKAGRNNQLGWYLCIIIFNTIGILPMVYLAFFQKKIIKGSK